MPGGDQLHHRGVEFAGEVDDLAPALRGGGAERALMGEQDREVGAGGAHIRQDILHRGAAGPKGEPLHELRLHDLLGGGDHVAHQRHAQPAALDHRPWTHPVGPPAGGGVEHVGGEPGVARFANPRAEGILPPVQVVIADDRRVQAHRVEGGHGAPAIDQIRLQGALHLIAAVEAQRGAGTRRRAGVHPPGERGGATNGTPTGPGVHPGLDGAVEVVGGEDPQQRRIARSPGRRGRSQRLPSQVLRHVRRFQAPVGPLELGGVQHAAAGDVLDEQVANVLVPVVDDRRVRQHAEPAAAALPIVVQGQGEGVGVGHRAVADAQAGDPLPRRPRQVDGVVRAPDNVVVVAGNRVTEAGLARGGDAEVPRALLEVGTEAGAADPDGAQGVLVGVELGQVGQANGARPEGGPGIERGGRGQLRAGPLPLHLVHPVDDGRGLHPRRGRAHRSGDLRERRGVPVAHQLVRPGQRRLDARMHRHPRQRNLFPAL